VGTTSATSRPARGARAACAAALLALVLCPAAAAHGGGGALGFRSAVTGIAPAAPGLSVTVLDSDDRLEVVNDSGKPLIVLGYEGEPYLAFRNGRVYRNVRSPATYLNDDRYGVVALPPDADAKKAPVWEEVARRERYDWHDHRIHWMSRTLPPKVRAAQDKPHHIFDWTVPARLDGRAVRISGSLDYEPPPGQTFPRILLFPLALVAVLGAAAVALRRRRRASAGAPPPTRSRSGAAGRTGGG
jgi:hypothetical protein